MMLLGDLLSDKCNLEMVIGGDKDCRIRRFKTKLIAMGMDKYDRVIIEPSGVFLTLMNFMMLYMRSLFVIGMK
ncbi:MAG: hypothetical protein L6U99_07145 [Clostridium sp.]|nr:MAG: hypothetical protein L6U99_07145 [Clostridium sp.]